MAQDINDRKFCVIDGSYAPKNEIKKEVKKKPEKKKPEKKKVRITKC